MRPIDLLIGYIAGCLVTLALLRFLRLFDGKDNP